MVNSYFESSNVTIYQADSREAWRWLPEHSADAIVTSPPYFGLRDYGHEGQIGLEASPQDYIEDLVDLLTGYGERVLKPEGSLWLNLGDTYSGGNRSTYDTANGKTGEAVGTARPLLGWPSKCLLMIPERVALALIERGWILRNRVVWAKPNGMPASVRDRLATKHEALFHFVRQRRYFYDLDAIREPHAIAVPGRTNRAGGSVGGASGGAPADGRQHLAGHANGKNPGDVWTIPTRPFPEAHFAVFPTELVRRPILATVPEGGTVLDPFFGAGTTGVMARQLGRKTIGIELSEDYCALAVKRLESSP